MWCRSRGPHRERSLLHTRSRHPSWSHVPPHCLKQFFIVSTDGALLSVTSSLSFLHCGRYVCLCLASEEAPSLCLPQSRCLDLHTVAYTAGPLYVAVMSAKSATYGEPTPRGFGQFPTSPRCVLYLPLRALATSERLPPYLGFFHFWSLSGVKPALRLSVLEGHVQCHRISNSYGSGWLSSLAKLCMNLVQSEGRLFKWNFF